MVQFDPKTVGIATITYYPKWYAGKLRSIQHADKVRGDLALEFARESIRNGYQLVVVDGGSTKTFRKELEKLDGVKILLRKKLGISPSKRLALRTVSKMSEVKVILLTEPEKISLINHGITDIAQKILTGGAEIVIPQREEGLFKQTYPSYMYESETEGNGLYCEALRSHGIMTSDQEDFDLFFGPRALKNEKKYLQLFSWKYRLIGTSFLAKLYSPEVYSNILFFPVINALRKKMRVVSVEVPFAYPVIQKENEEVGAQEAFHLKRKLQRMSILIDLMHFLSYLEKKKQSRLRQSK